jgi:hypothetical protein
MSKACKACKASGETSHPVGRGVATIDANVGHSPPDTDTVASLGYQVLEKSPAISLCCTGFQEALTANGVYAQQSAIWIGEPTTRLGV